MPRNLNASRFVTPGGIPYSLVDGPRMTFVNHGEQRVTAGFQMYASQVSDFAEEAMPTPFQIAGSPVVTLPPTLKLQNISGFANILSPVSISVEPFGNTDRPVDYFSRDSGAPLATYNQYAMVTVEYTTNIDSFFSVPRTNRNPETFLEPSFSTTAEVVSYKVDKKVAASTDPTLTTPGNPIKDFSAPLIKIIPVIERSLRWTWAVNPDFAKIFSLLGRINASALIWIPGAYEKTVMFMGVSGKQEFRFHRGGKQVAAPWNLEYKLAQRTLIEGDTVVTWNHFFNPDTQLFQLLDRVVSPTFKLPLYNTADFGNLFLAYVPPTS